MDIDPIQMKRAEDLVEGAISLGQRLARADASGAVKMAAASAAGRTLAKHAGVGAAISGALSKNPGLIGAGIGAAGGLASGLQKDEHGQRSIMRGLTHAAGGAALGAGVGHVGGAFAKNLGAARAAGGTVGDAVKTTGGQLLDRAKNLGREVMPTSSPPVGRAAPPRPGQPLLPARPGQPQRANLDAIVGRPDQQMQELLQPPPMQTRGMTVKERLSHTADRVRNAISPQGIQVPTTAPPIPVPPARPAPTLPASPLSFASSNPTLAASGQANQAFQQLPSHAQDAIQNSRAVREWGVSPSMAAQIAAMSRSAGETPVQSVLRHATA